MVVTYEPGAGPVVAAVINHAARGTRVPNSVMIATSAGRERAGRWWWSLSLPRRQVEPGESRLSAIADFFPHETRGDRKTLDSAAVTGPSVIRSLIDPTRW